MKILIVDDERTVVEVLVATLETFFPQHTVRGVENLNDAIGVAYEEGAVDLLISDIDLGDSDGFQVRAELAQLFPEMQTVFISGADLRGYASVTETLKILRKPLVSEEVIQAVEEAEKNVVPPRRPVQARTPSRNANASGGIVPDIGNFVAPLPRREPFAVPAPVARVESVPGGESAALPSLFGTWSPIIAILVGLAVVAALFLQKVEFRKQGAAPLGTPTQAQASVPELGVEVPQVVRVVAEAATVEPTRPEWAETPPKEMGEAILIGDDFEGADRALAVESQWSVHPVGQGAHEIVVGEGSLRARSSEGVCAVFEAASVTGSYDWTASLAECRIAEGAAGLVFGFRDPDNFYRISVRRPDNRLAVIRRSNGVEETIWEAEDGGGYGSLSAVFIAAERSLRVERGEGSRLVAIDLSDFEGGKFGVFVSRTPGAAVSGFGIRLRPGG